MSLKKTNSITLQLDDVMIISYWEDLSEYQIIVHYRASPQDNARSILFKIPNVLFQIFDVKYDKSSFDFESSKEAKKWFLRNGHKFSLKIEDHILSLIPN